MKLFIFFIIAFITTSNRKPQHCIFDGFSVIVIKLLNHKGKPRPKGGFNFFIKANESNNLGNKVSNKFFDTCTNILFKTDDKMWNSYAAQYNDLKNFEIKECYAIVLSDLEIKRYLTSDNKIIIKSRFKKNESVTNYTIKKDNIYPLCNSHGKWKNIKPVKIILNDENPSCFGNKK